MFKNWLNAYENILVTDISLAKRALEEFSLIAKDKKIILWGANSLGKTLFRLFKELNINISAFIDRNAKNLNSIEGVMVYESTALGDLWDSNTLLLASVHWKNQASIKNSMLELDYNYELINGYELQLPLQRALCIIDHHSGQKFQIEMCSHCTKERNQCDILRENIVLHKQSKVNRGLSKLTLIGCILGNVCTLKCKHCVEHVPFQRVSKGFRDSETILREIRTVADASEFITVVDFVGGEPFLHPKLPEIISQVRAIGNIGIINIFTNGTVLPNLDLLNELKKDYVMVYLSSYSVNLSESIARKIEKTYSILNENNVAVFSLKDFTWQDSSSFERREDTFDVLKQRFSDCFLKNCSRLYNGIFFRCLHHYAGYTTGILDVDNSVVDIFSAHSREELSERLDKFMNVPYIDACNYCELPYDAKPVPSGIQVGG